MSLLIKAQHRFASITRILRSFCLTVTSCQANQKSKTVSTIYSSAIQRLCKHSRSRSKICSFFLGIWIFGLIYLTSRLLYMRTRMSSLCCKNRISLSSLEQRIRWQVGLWRENWTLDPLLNMTLKVRSMILRRNNEFLPGPIEFCINQAAVRLTFTGAASVRSVIIVRC